MEPVCLVFECNVLMLASAPPASDNRPSLNQYDVRLAVGGAGDSVQVGIMHWLCLRPCRRASWPAGVEWLQLLAGSLPAKSACIFGVQDMCV
jgi:hypothetical protein